MTKSINVFKEKYLFPVTGAFFALYFLINSITFIAYIVNVIRWGDVSFISVTNILSSFIFNFAVLALTVLLFIKKPKIGFAAAISIALLSALIDSLFAVINLFPLYFDFFPIIVKLINLTNSALGFLSILVLLLVALNACLKKSNKIVAIAWIVPGAAVLLTMFLSLVSGIISTFFYGLGFAYIFTGIIPSMFTELLWAVCLLLLGYCLYSISNIPAVDTENAEEITEGASDEAISPAEESEIIEVSEEIEVEIIPEPAFESVTSSEPEPEPEPVSAPADPARLGVADEILKYKQFLDDGVITKEQFEAKKNQLLGL